MHFSLKGAAQIFQRLMDAVLRDMTLLFVYLDDILVASVSAEDYLTHLWQLFDLLSEHGLIMGEFLPHAMALRLVAFHCAVSQDIADIFIPIPTSHHGHPKSYVPKDLP